jgi:hypothetical protein
MSLLAKEQLDGVYEKLNRADENINSLNREIATFFKQHPAGGLSEDKQKAVDELFQFNATREIPPRFSVLIGETAHNLRSSLDHVVWALSSQESRLGKDQNAIGFPVFLTEPLPKDLLKGGSYQRKIQGIRAPQLLGIINDLQPYQRGNDATDTDIAIIHELNRLDKHRQLNLVEHRINGRISIPVSETYVISPTYGAQKTRTTVDPRQLKIEFTFTIAFKEIGKRKNQPVIPELARISKTVRQNVGLFVE